MQHDELVSTIIPVFNRAILLREAVSSVLAQTYRPIEIVIVDDGSTDDTAEMISALASEHPEIVKPLRVANGGPGAAREAGRKIAQGAFIQYLDSDDILHPQKFERQINGLSQNPECGVSYGMTRCYTIGDAPQDIPWKGTGEQIDTMFPSFLRSRWWDTSTPLYRRKVVDAAGAWLALRNEEDWEYDCRIASQGVRLHYCPSFVSDTRIHDGAMLSADGKSPGKLRDRAEAHRLILHHALNGAVGPDTSEMQHFARELFLLSRQCGSAGLSDEARKLFKLARRASIPERARQIDFVAYGFFAKLVGWSAAGRLTCALDELRK